MKALIFSWCLFAVFPAFAGVGSDTATMIGGMITQAMLVYIAVIGSLAAFFLFKLIKYAVTDKPTYYINRNNYNK